MVDIIVVIIIGTLTIVQQCWCAAYRDITYHCPTSTGLSIAQCSSY